MKKILVINAYSASNAGDGLLVDETMTLIRQAFGSEVDVTVLASYPDSFDYLGLKVLGSKPTRRGYRREYLALLGSKFASFDLVIGVGGGYLRAGSPIELLKMGLVMGPQLFQAARTNVGTVFLPQSIGPARFGSRSIMRGLLSRIDNVWVRDDRSAKEFAGAGVKRSPDLAILGMNRVAKDFDDSAAIILTVRSHRGSVPPGVYSLRSKLGRIDSYVQSKVGGNDDTAAVQSLMPSRILESNEFLAAPGARVVVAMRLHAALMAISAGHYVIHLSYERKGFGAFGDLGLSDFVFNVHSFDSQRVAELAFELKNSPSARAKYDAAISESLAGGLSARAEVVRSLQVSAGMEVDN